MLRAIPGPVRWLRLLPWIGLSLTLMMSPGLHAQEDAAAALHRGDLPGAERILTNEVRVHPESASSLSLLAVVLDEEGKYPEAGKIYARALALPHPSVSLLNNFGNHLAATGDTAGARAAFEKVLGLDPAHGNANVQLAKIEVDAKEFRAASTHLGRVRAGDENSPAVAVLRLQVLYGTGQSAAADDLLRQLTSQGQDDAQWTFTLGLALAAAGRYQQAETLFTRTLDLQPANADVLYNLGLASWRAGDKERALTVFAAAQKQRPDDVDLLYNLGVLCAEMDRKEAAVAWLARAGRLDPKRADIQLLLAHTSSDLGYGNDAFAAWDRYVQLQPGDDVGRRERAFTAVTLGNYGDAIAELKLYLAKHPDDALAHYDLGAANFIGDPDEALRQFDRALVLQPDLAAALSERGMLRYRRNELPAALKDLESANRLEPGDPTVLDELSQAYLLSGQVKEALSASEHAAQLAPNDRQVVLHLGLAQARSGDHARAAQTMLRVRELKTRSQKNGGLVQFFSQSPKERYPDFVARVENAAKTNPTDMTAQVEYLKVLLDAGRTGDAVAVAQRIEAAGPGSAILLQTGKTLLDAGQYAPAKDVLGRAVAVDGSADAKLQLAIATSNAVSPAEGLKVLGSIPVDQRHGQFWVAQAQMLDATGEYPAAAAAMERATAGVDRDPTVYRDATLMYLRHGDTEKAMTLLDEAVQKLPANGDLLLTKAVALDLTNKTSEAEALLSQIERRWPEWPFAWLVDGMALERANRNGEARQRLDTAIALGAQGADAYFCLAQAIFLSAPEQLPAAQAAIATAIEGEPNDALARKLAGEIDLKLKDYAGAVKQFDAALKLDPKLAGAHVGLASAYLGLNQPAKAETEKQAEPGSSEAAKAYEGGALGARLLRTILTSND